LTDREIAARLRELGREARALQEHLRRLPQAAALHGEAGTLPVEEIIRELERLARWSEAIAALAEEE
jgi:hypothetical protein